MKKLLALVLCLIFASTIGTVALAAGEAGTATEPTAFEDNIARTDVYLRAAAAAENDLSATVPLNVTLAVTNTNTIVAPTNYAIINTGAIGFKVEGISVYLQDAGTYSFDTTPGDNTLNITLNGLTLINAELTVPTTTAWNVVSGQQLLLTLAGSVGNITADLTTAQKVFTITYTIEAGLAA